VLGGQYEYRGEIVQRDNRGFVHKDWTLCGDCNTMMRSRGWLAKEMKGKHIAMYFKDGSTIELSRERFAHIERNKSWRNVKDQAVYFSNVTSSLVHLVKIYSRPESFDRIGNGVVEPFVPYQLRMF
jgi:hypothetical protein